MDIDLFQGILLGLLALGLLILIALLSTLGGIRKALERASSGETLQAATPSPATAQPEPVAQAEPIAAAEPATAEVAPVAAASVTPAAQEPTPAPSEQDSQAATIRAVLSQHGVETAAPAAETSAPAAQAAEPASVVAAHIDSDEPEEEPFQRDGRWWFKRGGELMVYNEGTAQWEGAERPAHWSAGSTPAAETTTMTAAPQASADVAATTTQPAVANAGAGWKCPSCGAINGSTAASCRMCFTARP